MKISFPVLLTFLLCVFAANCQAEVATPLRFVSGSFGVIVNDRVTIKNFQHQYSFNARANQTIILSFTGQGTMRGSVSCLGGGDGPYDGSGNAFVVLQDGQCVISVGANPMAAPWTGRFTLAVLLSNKHPR